MRICHKDAATGLPATYLSPYCALQVAAVVGQVHRHLRVEAEHLDVLWTSPQAFAAQRSQDPYQLHVTRSLRRPKKKIADIWRRPTKLVAEPLGCPAAYLPKKQALLVIYQHQAKTVDLMAVAHAVVESCLLDDDIYAAAMPPQIHFGKAARRNLFASQHALRPSVWDTAHAATLATAQHVPNPQGLILTPEYLRRRWLIPKATLAAMAQVPATCLPQGLPTLGYRAGQVLA